VTATQQCQGREPSWAGSEQQSGIVGTVRGRGARSAGPSSTQRPLPCVTSCSRWRRFRVCPCV